MTSFPVQCGTALPCLIAAAYLRQIADQFAGMSLTTARSAASEDWEAVEAALEALSDALAWIEGPL